MNRSQAATRGQLRPSFGREPRIMGGRGGFAASSGQLNGFTSGMDQTVNEPRQALGARKPSGGKRLVLFVIIIAAVLLCILAGILWVAFYPKAVTEVKMGDIKSIVSETASTEAPSIPKGETLHIRLNYETQQMKSIAVSIANKDKEVLNTGTFKLTEGGHDFSIAVSTATLEPGDYSVKLLNQDNHQVAQNTLKVTSPKEQ